MDFSLIIMLLTPAFSVVTKAMELGEYCLYESYKHLFCIIECENEEIRFIMDPTDFTVNTTKDQTENQTSFTSIVFVKSIAIVSLVQFCEAIQWVQIFYDGTEV